jgi:hypothetical protein
VRALVDHRRAVVLVTALLVPGGLWAVAGAPASPPRASHQQKVTEHVVLKLVKRTGSTKFQHTGRASGTASGSVRSKLTLTHSVVLRGTVTITAKQGKMRLKIDGRARSLELRSKFTGSASVIGGTGRYAHAKGNGTFTGIVNRGTWAATLDATGSMSL